MKGKELLRNKSLTELRAYARDLGIAEEGPEWTKDQWIDQIDRAAEKSELYEGLEDFLMSMEEDGATGDTSTILQEAAAPDQSTWSDSSRFISESETGKTGSLPDDLYLNEDETIVLNGRQYRVLNMISSSTLEAVVYRVRDEKDQLQVIKFYKNYKDKDREPNSRALEKIKVLNAQTNNILKLYDFGVGENKYLSKYCFEISDLAEGGNLLNTTEFKKKYAYEFIKSTFIPSLFEGISALHETGIVHCDLKPQNIFYKDKQQQEIVIGDYGSARTLNEATTQEVVSRVIGTEYYLPPEQNRRVVSPKNDYYALGMILIHLLYPEQFALDDDYRKVDNQKFNDLVLRQTTNDTSIIDFNPAFHEVNALIDGLTRYFPGERWGEQEVEKWLKGEYMGDGILPGILSLDINKVDYFNNYFVIKTYVRPEEGPATDGNINFHFNMGEQRDWNELIELITQRFIKAFAREHNIFIKYFTADIRRQVQQNIQRVVFSDLGILFRLLKDFVQPELKFYKGEVVGSDNSRYRLSYGLWTSLTPYFRQHGVDKEARYKETKKDQLEADFRSIRSEEQLMLLLRNTLGEGVYIAPADQQLISKDFAGKRSEFVRKKTSAVRRIVLIVLMVILLAAGFFVVRNMLKDQESSLQLERAIGENDLAEVERISQVESHPYAQRAAHYLDDELWRDAEENGTDLYYLRYLERRPQGKNATEARSRLAALNQPLEDYRQLTNKGFSGKLQLRIGEKEARIDLVFQSFAPAASSGKEIPFEAKIFNAEFEPGVRRGEALVKGLLDTANYEIRFLAVESPDYRPLPKSKLYKRDKKLILESIDLNYSYTLSSILGE